MAFPITRSRILWAVRLLLALAFGAAGTAKLMGAPMMIEVFAQVGIGQWFRYFTGGVELVGVALLLAPRTGLYGALVLMGTMIGAVFTHLVVIGGSAIPAVILGMLAALLVVQLWPGRGVPLLEGRGQGSTGA